jgi:hypothetical protein
MSIEKFRQMIPKTARSATASDSNISRDTFNPDFNEANPRRRHLTGCGTNHEQSRVAALAKIGKSSDQLAV